MSNPNTSATSGGPEYDDEVLDAGWVPPPEGQVAPGQARPAQASGKHIDEFLDIVYRSQGSDIE